MPGHTDCCALAENTPETCPESRFLGRYPLGNIWSDETFATAELLPPHGINTFAAIYRIVGVGHAWRIGCRTGLDRADVRRF